MVSPLYICGQSIYYFELSIRFHIGFGVWIILVKVKILNDVFVVVRFIMFLEKIQTVKSVNKIFLITMKWLFIVVISLHSRDGCQKNPFSG